MMDRLKASTAKWLVLVTIVLSTAAILIRGIESDIVWPVGTSAVNAAFVASFFRCRLAGTTASYLLAQVEPDADGVEFADAFMLGVAAITLFVPIYLVFGGSF